MLKESTRIFRFILIGSLNALITAVVVFIMMEVLDYGYQISNITAYIAALINNFFWSKYWIFSSGQGAFQREVPLFIFSFALAYSAQFLFLYSMVEVVDLNEYLAQFLGLFIYGGVNFIMNRRVTFRNR